MPDESIPNLSLELDQVPGQTSRVVGSRGRRPTVHDLVGASAGKIFDGGEELPVLVKGDSRTNRNWINLRPSDYDCPTASINVAWKTARPARPQPANPTLASLTEFELESDVGGIVRIDGRSVNEVKAYIEAGVLPSVVMESFKNAIDQV